MRLLLEHIQATYPGGERNHFSFSYCLCELHFWGLAPSDAAERAVGSLQKEDCWAALASDAPRFTARITFNKNTARAPSR